MDTILAETIINMETIGREQYGELVYERKEMSTKVVTDTIPKNLLSLFSCPPLKIPSKQKIEVIAIKNDFICSRLYISCCQTHDVGLN